MDLTIKQKEALNSILDGKNVFLTGPGGTGKSHLLKIFIEHYNKINILSDSEKELYVTSTTGISSLLINGKTLHSYAGIGLGNKSYDFYIDKITLTKNKSIFIKSILLNQFYYAKLFSKIFIFPFIITTI